MDRSVDGGGERRVDALWSMSTRDARPDDDATESAELPTKAKGAASGDPYDIETDLGPDGIPVESAE